MAPTRSLANRPRRAIRWASLPPLPPSTDVDGAVRVGSLTTLIVVVAVLVYVWLEPLDPVARRIIAGSAAAAVVWMTVLVAAHARRPAGLRHPDRWMVAWSTADIALISLVVAVTDGAASDLAFLYVLPVLFFTTLYPPAAQALLFTSTVLGYAIAAWASSVPVSWPALSLRLGTVGAAAILSSYLSARLREQADDHRQAETLAERRAQLLAVAALASRSLSKLEVAEVLENLIRSTASLGFAVTALFVVERDAGTYRCAHAYGLPSWWKDRQLPLDHGPVGAVIDDARARTVQGGAPRLLSEVHESEVQVAALQPVLSDDGTVVAVLCAGQLEDVAVAHEQAEALELMASVAGVALANARRFAAEAEARERLVELSQIQDDFVATASHELRTPLTVVQAAAELLDHRWNDMDEQLRRRLVTSIRTHGEDLQRLADRLLRFRELEVGAHEPAPVSIHLQATIRRVVDRTAYLTRNHGVRWEVDENERVLADLDLLETALEALIDNAARHTPPGTSITITAVAEDERVALSVEDDGPGLPPDRVDVLQEAFRRGGEVLTRTTRGVGLGLPTVQQIARLHGGDLRLRSSSGRGTSAGFTVPRLHERRSRPRLSASPVLDLRQPVDRA